MPDNDLLLETQYRQPISITFQVEFNQRIEFFFYPNFGISLTFSLNSQEMKDHLILLLFLLFLSQKTYADRSAYADSCRLKVESKNFIVIHFHDWTEGTSKARFKMMTTDQNLFASENNYAFIECYDKASGQLVFRKPSPALTKIEISEDEKYIVGISKIKIWNPVQMVVLSITGNLLKSRHIAGTEAKLSNEQLQTFKNKFKKAFALLEVERHIYPYNNSFFIDFIDSIIFKKHKKAWRYLFDFEDVNHLSKNFAESVTNWVFWFYEENPNIKFTYTNTELTSISLLDPLENRFEIKMLE